MVQKMRRLFVAINPLFAKFKLLQIF